MIHFLLLIWIVQVKGYYHCLCSYSDGTGVYPTPDTDSKPIGYLDVFDCKELIATQNTAVGWWEIAFEHQYGYVEKGQGKLDALTCMGSPSPSDGVTTMRHTTLTSTTVVTPTTTTPTSTAATPTSTTATPTTITTSATTTTTVPVVGDVYICPSILRQFTKEDGGALTQYGSYCYELVPTKAVWRRAAIDCKAKGGNLIHINHIGLQNHINKWINTILYNQSIWIGLHDIPTEGHFQWVSGDPVIFTNFEPGRDTTSVTETDCVEILAGGTYSGLWNNVPCGTQTIFEDIGRRNPFICEYPIYQYQNPQLIGK